MNHPFHSTKTPMSFFTLWELEPRLLRRQKETERWGLTSARLYVRISSQLFKHEASQTQSVSGHIRLWHEKAVSILRAQIVFIPTWYHIHDIQQICLHFPSFFPSFTPRYSFFSRQVFLMTFFQTFFHFSSSYNNSLNIYMLSATHLATHFATHLTFVQSNILNFLGPGSSKLPAA